jgi:septal ring factor EnvC (AmiA/AmiB activator)
MGDQPENLALIYLRRMDDKIDGLRDDMREVNTRLTSVDLGLAAVRREIAVLAEADAHLSARIDRLTDRIERVERRLDIAPAA